MSADTIITGGRIFRGLAEGFCEAVAIRDGAVLHAGSADDVRGLAGPGTRRIELEGRVAVPGFNDAHMHFQMLGIGMTEVRLRPEEGVRSVEEVLRRVAAEAKLRRPGEWIQGRGYDHNEFDDPRHPTAEELDRAAPDNPVYVKRTCGHVAVANSRALREAGIGHNTPSPDGGLIERRDNRLTGLLAERAMLLVSAKIPKPTRDELLAAIARAGAHMLSQGFTSVMDAAVGHMAGMAEIEAYEHAAANGTLPVRVWTILYGDPGGVAEAAYAGGYRNGREVGLLRYGGMKIFADGSAGGLTAAMSEPYRVGDPDNRGILVYEQAEAHRLLKAYHNQGYQLAIHAIGDAAIEQILSGIEACGSPGAPIAGRRHRIEHCGFLTPDQHRRMTAAGIYPVPQPIFMYEFGDLYVRNVGEARAAAAYPMRTWLESGQQPAASSDSPVSTTDPFKSLYTMTTRRTRRGTLIGPDERLTMEQAVHVYTYCGAFSQFAEDRYGRLIPGQRADVAVLSQDIFSCPAEALEAEVRCDLTLLDGRVAFDRHGQLGA